MQKILVVDDDGLSRTLLAETVRALGHQVSMAADAQEALRMLSSVPHDGVISDVRMPGWDGIELVRRIGLLADAPPVVLMSADPDFDISDEAHRRGVRPASFLQKPFDRLGVARAVGILANGDVTAPTGTAHPDVAAAPIGKDDAPEWLATVRGSARQLPPARVWYVAWRRQATGAIVLRSAGEITLIGVKRGEIVDLVGVPGLLADRLPVGVAADSLTTAVGGAMAMGSTLDSALAAASADVARWMLGARSGDVRFDPEWTPGPGAFPLPGTPTMLLARALVEVPTDALQRAWQSVASSRIRARSPCDVPPERWGLDPLALRVHRSASGQAVQALVYELSGGAAEKRIQALRVLDLLLRLNLITLGA